LAEVAAWSAVHGLALLILDGFLSALPEEAREAVLQRTVEWSLAASDLVRDKGNLPRRSVRQS
jgi:hypothetical protein